MFLKCISKYETRIFFNNKRNFSLFHCESNLLQLQKFQVTAHIKILSINCHSWEIPDCNWENGGDRQNIQVCLELKINKGCIQKCGEKF